MKLSDDQLAELEHIRGWACCTEPERRFMAEITVAELKRAIDVLTLALDKCMFYATTALLTAKEDGGEYTMAEHACEWGIGFDEDIGGAFIVCDVEGCSESLDIDQAEAILNSHDDLLEVLESLQYIDKGRCPHCGGKQYHEKGCYVAEAIRKASR